MRISGLTIQLATAALLASLLSACTQQLTTATLQPNPPLKSAETGSTSPLIVEFENKIVEKLLAGEKERATEIQAGSSISLRAYENLEARIHRLEEISERLTEVNQQLLNSENKQAIRSHHRLLARLNHQVVHQRLASTTQLGSRYAGLLEYYTTQKMTADSLLESALALMKANETKIEQTLLKAGIPITPHRLLITLTQDEALFLDDSPEDKHLYLNLVSDLITTAPDKFAEIIAPGENAPIEVHAAPDDSSTNELFTYQTTHQSPSTTSVVSINLQNMNKLPLYEAEANSFIYGIPGMHQLTSAQLIAQNNSGFTLYDLPAFTLGWGLYTAQLARDHNLYRSHYGELGSLIIENRYAARLIADIRINRRSWGDEQAKVFLQEAGFETAEGARWIINTARQSPGVHTSALSGLLTFTSLRSKLEAQLGKKFSLRKFHQQILASGPLPLWLVEEEMSSWLRENR